MSSAYANSGIWLLAALLASACAIASTSQQIELLRQAFLELNGRQVLSCLGPPSDFDYPDEHRARWVYIHALPDMDAHLSGHVTQSPFLSPKIRRFLADPLNADLAPGFCRLTIQMVDGQVTGAALVGAGPDFAWTLPAVAPSPTIHAIQILSPAGLQSNSDLLRAELELDLLEDGAIAIVGLTDLLRERRSASLMDLFEELPTRLDCIATFLAVLEMMRLSMIVAFQRKLLGEIRVALCEQDEGESGAESYPDAESHPDADSPTNGEHDD